jgi:uncharacterized protein (DUF1501 family)
VRIPVTDLDTSDLLRHGPTPGDAAVRWHADAVRADLDGQRQSWLDRGFTRRRFIAGAGMAGVAALGAQYVTTKVAFAAPSTSTGNTLIFIFLRGGCDGLRLLVPAADALGASTLRGLRQSLSTPATLPLVDGWAVNAAFKPLMPQWGAGTLAFVPAVSSGDVSRSHFQAQDYWECGGPPTVVRTGWLDRLLTALGPGTTFRAVAEGSAQPRSFAGQEAKLVLSGIDNFRFPANGDLATRSQSAIATLYRGLSHPLAANVAETLAALGQAEKIASITKSAGDYGAGGFGNALSDLARLIKGGAGVEVATVDVGGFDTHTDEANDLDRVLGGVATALAGFFADLGASSKTVTVATMTEFGRRVGSNGDGGTDHGHGSVMLLLGGGVKGGRIHGKWAGLGAAQLDHGDVPGTNHAFDVLGEVVQRRLGVGTLASIFPNHAYVPLSVMS